MRTFSGKSKAPVASKMLPVTVTYYLKLLPQSVLSYMCQKSYICLWYPSYPLESSLIQNIIEKNEKRRL